MRVVPLGDDCVKCDGMPRCLEGESWHQDSPCDKRYHERTQLLTAELHHVGQCSPSTGGYHEVTADEKEQSHVGNAYNLQINEVVGERHRQVLYHYGENGKASHPVNPV